MNTRVTGKLYKRGGKARNSYAALYRKSATHTKETIETSKLSEMSHKHLLDLEELNIEDQSRVSWDTRKTLLSVGEVCGNCQSPFTTNGHACNTNVPTLNYFTSSELEAEWLAFLVCYEKSEFDAYVG
jgi:hypothetical protein